MRYYASYSSVRFSWVRSLFVIGANGVGKSSLMHFFYTQNSHNGHRIAGHRQANFHDKELGTYGQSRSQINENNRKEDLSAEAIWKVSNNTRNSASLLKFMDAQNAYTQNIYDLLSQDPTEDLTGHLKNNQAPLDQLNHVFSIANMGVKFRLVENNLKVSKNDSPLYSVPELSDGERNALLLAVDIITGKPGTLFFIDEPEKHLNGGISAPLLDHLFNIRSDCSFVVSTHDLNLVHAHAQGSVSAVLLRGCTNLDGLSNKIWQYDYIDSSSQISESVKRDILGPKRILLFIEGDDSSLDRRLYSLIFPTVTLSPKGGWVEVDKSVVGINSNSELSWSKAFGIVDNDAREAEEIEGLNGREVFVLPFFTIESIYYHPALIKRLAERLAPNLGINPTDAMQRATTEILEAVEREKSRLCKRVIEKRVRSLAINQLPTLDDLDLESQFTFTPIDVPTIGSNELSKIDGYLVSKDIEAIISRYPIRETNAIGGILKSLHLPNKKVYIQAMLNMLSLEPEALEFVRSLFNDLHEKINP